MECHHSVFDITPLKLSMNQAWLDKADFILSYARLWYRPTYDNAALRYVYQILSRLFQWYDFCLNIHIVVNVSQHSSLFVNYQASSNLKLTSKRVIY